jgi:signal transduction histidine kinase
MINSVLSEPTVADARPLVEILDDVVWTARARYDGCLTFTRAADVAEIVIGSPVSVRRAAANLVDNAIRAAGPGGNVHLSARLDGDLVEIIVDDDGPGFGAIRGGAGIGLSVVEAVTAQAGGTLSFAATSAGGVRAVLCLPTGLAGPDLEEAS